MANKEKETKEEEVVEGGEKKKSGNMLLIIIIVVLVLILVIGGVVVAMMSGSSEEHVEGGTKKEAAAHGESKEAPAEGEHAAEGEAAEGGHGEEAGTEAGLMFPLETFTVNLLSESGRRYLKVDMTMEMEGEELSPELEEKKPIFRDVIIRHLSSKSLEEISTLQGKDKLKEGIVAELNKRLHDGKIKNIYFTSFVVQ